MYLCSTNLTEMCSQVTGIIVANAGGFYLGHDLEGNGGASFDARDQEPLGEPLV